MLINFAKLDIHCYDHEVLDPLQESAILGIDEDDEHYLDVNPTTFGVPHNVSKYKFRHHFGDKYLTVSDGLE
ncbi:hypothetical protein PRIPAC_80940 [Pristionchus pacificus]|nr:hypothetical protein PRIPAC_80940 [Pristionchus pacificus]